ncbi:MAG: FAD-binding oxidoreductase [Parachlamydiaceae bacterium]
MDDHKALTQRIQNEMLAWLNKEAVSPLENRRASHVMRFKGYKAKGPKLSLSSLNRIVKIEDDALYAEPYVTQEELAKATLPLGKLPPVIAEFKKITVGGAIMGSSLESSSHRFGQFNDPCLEYELLLGDGSLIKASPHEHEDLFYAVSGSFGSLALLTLAKIPLIPIKPYVKVESVRYHNLEAFFKALKDLCHEKDRPDYIEGLIFDKNDLRVITGSFSDEKIGKFYSQKSTSAEWYHQFVYKNDRFSMSTYDYLFRYDRGAFWMGAYALYSSLLARFLFENTLFHPLIKPFLTYPEGKYNQLKFPPYLFRRIAGGFFDSYRLYKWLHAKKEGWFKKHFVIQDFYIPEENAEKMVEYTMSKNRIYPLWICPCKGAKGDQLLSPHAGDKLFFDIGIYGFPFDSLKGYEASSDLEKKTYELSGRKMFYSYNFLSKEELEKLYPLEQFNSLRARYKGDVFPSFLEKLYG